MPEFFLLLLVAWFVFFCAYLTVRFFERRERWVKWTLLSIAAAICTVSVLWPLVFENKYGSHEYFAEGYLSPPD
jgi:hypothetical protein